MVNSKNNQIGDQDVRAQYYNAAGAKLGPEIYVAGKVGVNESEPSVAMDARGDFVVSWTEQETGGDTNVLAKKFNPSSVPTSGIVQVGVGTFREHQSSVAMDAQGNFAVAYTRDTNNSNPDVFAKRYNTTGQLLSTITVAGSALAESLPSIAMTPDGRFDVAYQIQNNPLNSDISAARYSAAGTLLGVTQVANTSFSEAIPGIAMDNAGNAVVAYEKSTNNNYDIKAKRITASGALGAELNIRSTIAPETSPTVALQPSGGVFAVSFEQQLGNNPGIVEVATVDTSNTVTHIYDISNNYAPTISALGANGFLLSYQSVIGGNLSNNIFGQRGSYF